MVTISHSPLLAAMRRLSLSLMLLLALAADLAANFEVKSKYSLTLSAADPSGASVSTEVEVTVVDVNDPPVFDLDLTLDVLENDIEPFATFRAFDEDDADGFQATYDLFGQ